MHPLPSSEYWRNFIAANRDGFLRTSMPPTYISIVNMTIKFHAPYATVIPQLFHRRRLIACCSQIYYYWRRSVQCTPVRLYKAACRVITAAPPNISRRHIINDDCQWRDLRYSHQQCVKIIIWFRHWCTRPLVPVGPEWNSNTAS
jgi:hypothetical protein